MARSVPKLNVGDLLEIRVPGGLSYVQYVGKHSEYGDVIRVIPSVHRARPADLAALLRANAYLTFYPARIAVVQCLVKVVASLPPSGEVPKRVRRAGARAPSGAVINWILEDDGHETLRTRLTDTERRLPIAAIWNHELLVDRLAENWLPEQEG